MNNLGQLRQMGCTIHQTLKLISAAAVGLLSITAPATAQDNAHPWAPELVRAMERAGQNRAQLQRVLDHFKDDQEPLKWRAAAFLITNMHEHGYIEYAFFDAHGNEIAYDALNYKNYGEALAAKDALEAEHGSINYAKKAFHADLETITADFLIENIDAAFTAWRSNPWAKDISFEIFCEYILPYRCTNEPLESWRPAVMERVSDVAATIDNPTDMASAYAAVQRRSESWIRFDELYYLHPTDQGYAEMCRTKAGRCEDMTTLYGYAFMAAALLSASDYTPWWAHRDNNHAWTVCLDTDGRGRHPDGAPAAKVYRKTFARQPQSLGAVRLEHESVPAWLGRSHYIDVTDQYKPTTDVTIQLLNPPVENARFAYVCVFNGGEWRPIQWSWIKDNSATFAKLGRNLVYLPAYYRDEAVIPAAPPFILTDDGTTIDLNGGDATAALVIRTSKSPDEPGHPQRIVAAGHYELSYWSSGWQRAHSFAVSDETGPVTVDLPAGRLYWLTQTGSRRLERIFTITEGDARQW